MEMRPPTTEENPRSSSTGRNDRSPLLDLLTTSREKIVEEWLLRVRRDEQIPKTDELNRFLLIDHIPEILRRITTAMRSHLIGYSSSSETVATVGESPDVKAHSEIRFRQGYQLPEVLREFGHLRTVIMEVWGRESIKADAKELSILHACLDEILISAAEEIANRSAKTKDIFLAKLSHELSSPLTVIIAHLEKLSVATATHPELHRSIEIMSRSAENIHHLAVDLLDIAGIMQGKFKLVPATCHLESVATFAFASVQTAVEAKGLEFDLEIQSNVELFIADSNRLQQAIVNLLSNAIKFTPPGGRIRLRATLENEMLEFQISDTGEGISAEFLPRMFMTFLQEDTESNVRGSLGLGLTIVKEIAELHGGHVSATSKGKNRGADFRLAIPFRTSHA
jgi:signal transduction histidine kinase